MVAVINLGFVVDTASVLAACPNPSQDATAPTPVPGSLCFLIAPPSQARAGLASANLRLAARHLPLLRWQGVSLSGNTGQGVIIYGLARVAGSKGHTGQLETAVARVVTQQVPLPCLVDGTNTDPPTFTGAPFSVYILETPVSHVGMQPIEVRFYLTTTDTYDGQPALLGYFQWHATLTVH
ncbi:AidA/PixA family protein [Nitrospirillum sp. BR 11164]|uniref:AidA/PixA family protein n=1 Tax=Nitrospirillum sp. BR 11164 TaxID=3104324 RepID=UPI002AFEC877|nr:AidA/PixA family protein [Nitrospirillum sp. BR 11164]MEA1648991.1 AidA/PixA family protein [Nitrospirillum sp. BR 11164]